MLPDRASLHDDVVLVAVGRTGARAHYRGHHGIREWLGDPAGRAMAEVQLHPDDVRHGDDRVIVLGRITRRGPESPVRFEDAFAIRFEFAGDLIRRIETYASHEEALRVRT